MPRVPQMDLACTLPPSSNLIFMPSRSCWWYLYLGEQYTSSLKNVSDCFMKFSVSTDGWLSLYSRELKLPRLPFRPPVCLDASLFYKGNPVFITGLRFFGEVSKASGIEFELWCKCLDGSVVFTGVWCFLKSKWSTLYSFITDLPCMTASR